MNTETPKKTHRDHPGAEYLNGAAERLWGSPHPDSSDLAAAQVCASTEADSVTRRVKVTGDLFHPRLPPGAVYVARAAPGLRKSPYGNPYPVKTYGLVESLRRYRLHAESFDLTALRRDLAGRDLACWCPLDQPCHADVLLEMANP